MFEILKKEREYWLQFVDSKNKLLNRTAHQHIFEINMKWRKFKLMQKRNGIK